MEETLLRYVVLWKNGTVLSFDQESNPLAEFTGTFNEVKDRIDEESDADTVWLVGGWRGRGHRVLREDWFKGLRMPPPPNPPIKFADFGIKVNM